MTTDIISESKDLLERAKTMTREAVRELLDTVSEEVRHAYYDLKEASYFVPENADLAHRREHLSPSGKFKLVITPFTTGAGSWSYTQGLVYRIGYDEPIAEVRRNYHAFPFLFIEEHPKGPFLVAGQDYQGQTVIELATGRRRDVLGEGAEKGCGFCWSSYEWVPSAQALLVEGCYWAFPYEFRFYDFSDPMQGWPQIGDEVCIDEDRRKPELLPNGDIKVFQTAYRSDKEAENDDEDAPEPLGDIAAFTIYRREGLKLTEIEAWVSEKEQERRRLHKEANERYEKWLENYKSTDPLYLAMLEGVKDPVFQPEDHIGIGVTYDKWCPDFQKEEKRICRRIHTRGKNSPDCTSKESVGYTIDLEWGAETGPVKLVIYKDGKKSEDKFFMEHSVESVQAAFAYAFRSLVHSF